MLELFNSCLTVTLNWSSFSSYLIVPDNLATLLKIRTHSFSLGITKTKYTPKGSYYDLVGQVSYLQNKYNSRD